jgi:predicted thioesterase
VAVGQTVSITVTAADADGNLANLDINWDDGSAVVHWTVGGSSATVTFSKTFTTARTINWSATAYDTVGAASNILRGSFTVTAPHNRAPTLVKNVAPSGSVAVGQTVSITVTATDPDGNLANVDINWNDGSAVVHRAVGGSSATVTFTKTFTTARTINWSTTAYDTAGAASNMLTSSFAVR